MIKNQELLANSSEDDETHKTVVDIVSQAVIALLGKEPPSTQWRQELNSMIPRTIGRLHDDGTCPIRTAPALWSRYRRGSHLIMVSELGVERWVGSAMELACAFLLPEIERGYAEYGLSQRAIVDPKSSFIYVDISKIPTSSSGLTCPKCSANTFASTKSLWWHLQGAHNMAHNAAVEAATNQSQRDERAIVLFDPSLHVEVSDEVAPVLAAPVQEHQRKLGFESSQRPGLVTTLPDPWTCAQQGHLEELQKHYDPGILATLRDKRGALLLHWAAGAGHSDMVRFLIDEAHTPVDAPQRGHRAFNGRTALHWAARNGHVETVHYLVHGAHAKVDVATVDGTTAFCWASWQGHFPVLQVLNLAGCCATAENRFGCNAVLWAAQGTATVECIEWIASLADWKKINHAGHGVLHKAAQRGRRDICEWLLSRIHEENLVELVGPDNDNAVPSDLAGMEGHVELARDLAIQEMLLVKRAKSARELPEWLVPYSQEPVYLWEEGAGMLRMRSALDRDPNVTKQLEASRDID